MSVVRVVRVVCVCVCVCVYVCVCVLSVYISMLKCAHVVQATVCTVHRQTPIGLHFFFILSESRNSSATTVADT